VTAAPARHVVAVASGKGGVGKSTVSLNLALALRERGLRVGLLDADFYGPDIPLMVNLKRDQRLDRWAVWRAEGMRLDPVERFGLKLMSVGFLLAEGQALEWPAQMVEFIARQLVVDVEWGDLDVLVIDLPPGTADVQQQLVRLLPLAGAIVVVSPQDVAHLDAKRVVELLRRERVPILGAIENMTGLVCPHCGSEIEVFPRVREDRSIWSLGVGRLGSVPLDPALAQAGDQGRPLLVGQPESPQATAFRTIADRVTRALNGGSRHDSTGH
jgi:ATP-binding protein involved in chromosome partitioning